MPDYGRIARIAAPLALGAAGCAIVVPLVADALGEGADVAPDPTGGPRSTPPADASASTGARIVEGGLRTRPVNDAPAARRTYANPVFSQDAPDPAVMRADDGMFYAYTTESAYLPFQVLRSADLTSWERVGGAFEGTGPSWIKEHRWAPDVQKTGDHYTMTYSARGHDGNMKVGYATSRTPQGPFTDRGVLLEGPSGGYFIDPNLKQTADGWVLYYGSTGGSAPADQTGISAVGVDIAADGAMRARGPGSVVLSEAGERELVEGAWMHERDGQYYLFYSDGKWDAKGGEDDYALKVARGPSPTGPFTKLDRPVLAAGGGFTSTGHNSIVTDDAGQDWLLYHAWGPDHSEGRMLMLDPIEWQDGWPTVNGGNGPSTGPMDAPVIDARRGVATVAAA